MAHAADCAIILDRLDEELRLASALVPDVFSQVIESGGTQLRSLRQSRRAVRIDCLIEAGAWTEAAFALVELELPTWKIRRLVHEDGEWLCSLSRQPHLPVVLDHTAEANQDVLPLAVLRALVKARRRSSTAPKIILQVSYDFTNRPACPHCGRSMHRMHTRLGADGFPELGTFRCGERGVSVTEAASDQFNRPNAIRVHRVGAIERKWAIRRIGSTHWPGA
jgi:hypothetical protein